jgi:hypothetical protein
MLCIQLEDAMLATSQRILLLENVYPYILDTTARGMPRSTGFDPASL